MPGAGKTSCYRPMLTSIRVVDPGESETYGCILKQQQRRVLDEANVHRHPKICIHRGDPYTCACDLIDACMHNLVLLGCNPRLLLSFFHFSHMLSQHLKANPSRQSSLSCGIGLRALSVPTANTPVSGCG